MTNPLISIIVPCYKIAQYLPGCIESIMRQTYPNLEIILVDDGSPDDTGDICDQYARMDSRIQVIHKNNGGVSDARNAALDIARGEYIACVDGDDSVCENYIETMYNLIISTGSQMALSNFVFNYGGDCKIDSKKSNIIQFSSAEAIDCLFYQKYFDDYPWCKLYHKSLFEGLRYPEDMIYEDTCVTYKLIQRCHKLVYTDEIVYKYLIRKDSYEGVPFSNFKMDCAMRVFKLLENDLSLVKHQASVSCRILSLSCHLLMKCPRDYEKIDVLWKKIVNNRFSVLLDSKARPQARFASFISYFGITIMKFFFKIVDKRG